MISQQHFYLWRPSYRCFCLHITVTKVDILLYRHIASLIYRLFVDHSVFGSSGKLGFIVLVWRRVVIQSILQNVDFLSVGFLFACYEYFA